MCSRNFGFIPMASVPALLAVKRRNQDLGVLEEDAADMARYVTQVCYTPDWVSLGGEGSEAEVGLHARPDQADAIVCTLSPFFYQGAWAQQCTSSLACFFTLSTGQM